MGKAQVLNTLDAIRLMLVRMVKKSSPITKCPIDPPSERLGCGKSDDVSEPVKMGKNCLYVTKNERLSYIGVSTLEGPTRFFAQGEDATKFLEEYDKMGAKKFIKEYTGYGFW